MVSDRIMHIPHASLYNTTLNYISRKNTLYKLSGLILLLLGHFSRSKQVQVDIRPCFFACGGIVKDVGSVSESYMTSLFSNGFWSAAQLTPSYTSGTLDLTNSDSHGKCNVIFIGFSPSMDQKLQLQEYSAKFRRSQYCGVNKAKIPYTSTTP